MKRWACKMIEWINQKFNQFNLTCTGYPEPQNHLHTYAIKIKMFKSGEDNLSHSIDTNQRKLQKRTLKIFRTYPNQFDAKVWMQLLVGGVLKWTRQLHANRRSNSVSGLSERVRRRVMIQRSVYTQRVGPRRVYYIRQALWSTVAGYVRPASCV